MSMTIPESKIYAFWYNMVNNILCSCPSINESDICDAVDAMKRTFRNERFPFTAFSELNFDTNKFICAYLRYFAPSHFIVTHLAALNFFDSVPNFKLELAKKTVLTIASVGGGPGSDLYGFCTALVDPSKDNVFTGQLKSFIIDKYHWQGAARDARQLLVDLTKPWAETFKLAGKLNEPICLEVDFRDKEKLKENRQMLSICDVILVVKVVSVLDTRTRDSLLEEIFSAMSHKSVVIFVDTRFGIFDIRSALNRLPNRGHSKFILLHQKERNVYYSTINSGSCQSSSFEVHVIQKF